MGHGVGGRLNSLHTSYYTKPEAPAVTATRSNFRADFEAQRSFQMARARSSIATRSKRMYSMSNVWSRSHLERIDRERSLVAPQRCPSRSAWSAGSTRGAPIQGRQELQELPSRSKHLVHAWHLGSRADLQSQAMLL